MGDLCTEIQAGMTFHFKDPRWFVFFLKFSKKLNDSLRANNKKNEIGWALGLGHGLRLREMDFQLDEASSFQWANAQGSRHASPVLSSFSKFLSYAWNLKFKPN